MTRGEIGIEPIDELALWNRPGAGELPRWVRGMIALACAISVFVVAASTNVLWRMGGSEIRSEHDAWWWHYGPPLAILVALVVAFLPRSSTSRWVRLAVVLPIVHVIAMVIAWRIVPSLAMPLFTDRTPMIRALPVFPMLLLVVGATVTVGASIARRPRERVHAIVMLALANLLLLGLWAPIACRLASGSGTLESWDIATGMLGSPAKFALLILPLPFTVASAFTAIAIHRPRLVHRFRGALAVALLATLSATIATRLSAWHGGFLLYDNAVHLLLVTALVAIGATAALSITTWLGSRSAGRRLAAESATRSGTISDDGDPVVACLQITSWLRGPRLVTRPFVAITADGELSIPMGIEVASPIPHITTTLKTGEAVVVLRQGDRIRLGGFVEETSGDSPFRSAQASVPGPDGVIVGVDAREATSGGVGLAAWRPSVAYMMILIVAAIPGLVGLLAPTWK